MQSDREIEQGGARPVLVTAPGARATEAALLREIAELAKASRADLSLLRDPVRVVVPSRSLREHLCSALTRERGASLAGITVQTSFQLASEILERRGVALTSGEELFPVLVARSARGQAALRECLDHLAGGYAAVEAAVSDLFDAGFEAIHADAVDELVVEALASSSSGRRARAVVEVAREIGQRTEPNGLAHRSARFRRAREVLEGDPARALPARAVLVFGFADATGVQTDFIEALVRYRSARVYVNQPRDPADSGREDSGVAFSRRFRGRIAGSVDASEPSAEANSNHASPPRRPRVHLLRAPGESAEVRAVANRVRELVAHGVTPERIGVVARDFTRYRYPLRQHFTRLGVPFSALGEGGPQSAAGRRLAALLAIFRQPSSSSAERWLESVERLPLPALRSLSHTERADLRMALHRLGVARLADFARFDVGDRASRGGMTLPVRRGLVSDPAAQNPSRSPRRVLPTLIFDAARDMAARLGARLAGWPNTADLQTHVARLRALAEEDLGWSAAEPSAGELLLALPLAASRAASEELDRDEFLLYLERSLRAAGRAPLGGAGGGVQVLGVMEARSRTFQHLFVLGMNRGVFPRAIVEDPLLSDALRGRLRAVLPDLPVKAEGYDEERFLFAELLSAGDHVVLSTAVCDDAGKAQPASPLLLRLPREELEENSEDVPSLFAERRANPSDEKGPALRPAFEQAQLAGLYGTRREFGAALAAALRAAPWPGAAAESAAGGSAEKSVDESAIESGIEKSVESATEKNGGAFLRGAASVQAQGRARVAVLAEFDPGYALQRELGPYFGFLGPIVAAADPRRAALSITTLEDVGACAWQAFLKRLLHLEAAPDALGDLPHADPRLLGSITHAVLERLVTSRVPGAHVALEEVVAREPAALTWPEPGELEALLLESASAFARSEGIPLEGFGLVLAAMARPYVESARDCGWPSPGSGTFVLGAEVTGEVVVEDDAGDSRRIGFRADRVDVAEGGLRLTDYKTGKPLGDQKKPEGRRRKHIEEVTRGSNLQSVAYAIAGSALSGREADGRLLYLAPDLDTDLRVFSSRSDDVAFTEAFGETAARVLAAWDQGSFFPRLIEGKNLTEPRRCEFCDVKDACLRGDSGARGRLERFTRERAAAEAGFGSVPQGAAAPEAAERALLGLFNLRGGAE